MTFSVIIPCYNCETTLEATVDSIRAAGLPEYEIILIDDGSTDGTAALCGALCARYPELRCIHQKNAGVSAARNRGIDEAAGDYVWFVDADDTVDAGALTRAAQLAAARKPDMLLFGMRFEYYHKGTCYRSEALAPPCEGLLRLPELQARFQEFYSCNALTPVWNKLYRRSVLAASGVRFHAGMILMEDFLFVLELLPDCETICSLPEPIYRYRQAEDEKGAYRRLQRIADLAAYLQPFEAAAEKLRLPPDTVAELYRMLLGQKLYYAPLGTVRALLAAHAQSKYASIQMGSPLGVYLRSRKTQLRHKIAVAVKSSGLYQRYKAGRNG